MSRPTSRPRSRVPRLELLEDRLAPANFTVTNANDAGPGSLRQAVLDANANPGADLVDFSSFFNTLRTITLASEIGITDAVTIDGPSAATVTISGNNAVRIFNTQAAPAEAAINLADLTLKLGRGDFGGAVRAGDESLSATRCTFTANSASSFGGAIDAGGAVTLITCAFESNAASGSGGAVAASGRTLTATGCVFKSNSVGYAGLGGGGIYVAGSGSHQVTLTRCSISENVTNYGDYGAYGGGLYVDGTLLLESSTASGNLALGYSGYDAYVPSAGGGIFVSGNATIRNSTISGNGALSCGGIFCSGSLVVQSSTITGNTADYDVGGISGRWVTLESSIVAMNSAPRRPDIVATTVNARASAIFDRTGIITFNDQGANRPAGEDPRLGPLTDNGGPTKTHALLPGSPCVNSGSNPANLPTDQRGPGFPRVLSGAPDMGAFELMDPVPTATSISLPATITSAGGTSYAVVVRYNDDVGIDLSTIDFNDIAVIGPGYAAVQTPIARSISGSGQVVTVTYTLPAPGGTFDIYDNGLYIVAVAAKEVADVDTPTVHFVAPAALGKFRVSITGTVVVDEVSDIDDGNTTAGHVSLREAVRLTDATTETADTIAFDPQVFGTPRTIALTAGQFSITYPLTLIGPGAGLLTLNAGGASRLFNIALADSKAVVNVSGLTLINGLANGGNGGAISANGRLAVSDVVISNCQTNNNENGGGEGGGIFASAGLTLSGVAINNSTAAIYGGGVCAIDSTLLIERSTLANNVAGYSGGGLCIIGGILQISETAIIGNSAYSPAGFGYGGGGIYISVYPAGSFVRSSTISGNIAANGASGGGIYQNSPVPLSIANCTITGNATPNRGGGIAGGSVVLNSTIIAGNSAGNGPDLSVGSTVSSNNSLIGVADSGSAALTGTDNLTGALTAPLNPMLAPLADNGGPTKTHALLPGSPAINAGNNTAGLAYDQRGPSHPRVIGAAADIGAHESVYLVPTATAISLPTTITSAGASSFAVVVRYQDETDIDLATINLYDIVVTGPGYAAPQTPTGLFLSGSGQVVTVTYTLPAPGGAFDPLDYGLYSVAMVGNQIGDTDLPVQHFVVAAPFSRFRVAIPFAFVVDEPSDIDDGNTTQSHRSLREAIRLANAAAGTADTITFDPAVFSTPRTITLKGGEFAITDPLTIIGPGTGLLTLNGAGASRLFNINMAGSGALVNLSNLTLTNGMCDDAGGAILDHNAGLALAALVISNCRAITGGGGGIYVTMDSASVGAVMIERCSIVNNLAGGDGGGLYIFGPQAKMQISESTVSGNQSNTQLSAHAGFGGGGIVLGLSAAPGSFIRNSTISGNVAANGGGLSLAGTNATLAIANCTVTSNSTTGAGGGVAVHNGSLPSSYTGGSVSLDSTIIAGNSASNGPDLYFTFQLATFVRSNNSLIGVANKAGVVNAIGYVLGGAGNLTGTLAAPLNPMLAPLADNGGPTKTHALLPASPAINAGSNPANLPYDQRGPCFPRVFESAADIGAFEVQQATVRSVVVNAGQANLVQRSIVTSVTIAFSGPVTFTGQPAAAFRLTRTGPGAPSGNVTLAVDLSGSTATQTVARLTFSGALTEGANSLVDGNYTLTVLSGQVYGGLLGGDSVSNLFRLYADMNGDKAVNGLDLSAFRTAFGSSLSNPNYAAELDANGDGAVNGLDLAEFRTRFGTSLP